MGCYKYDRTGIDVQCNNLFAFDCCTGMHIGLSLYFDDGVLFNWLNEKNHTPVIESSIAVGFMIK